ncbi:MAG: triacylglycerol lipase [Lachnospiraceae bacterium]|nr:triacylglycerol lipase [Lachnospiraceae bacterium]
MEMKKTLKRCVLALLLPGMLNFILLSDAANQRMAASQVPLVIRIGLLITLAVCFGLLYLGLLVMPAFDSVKTGQRVRMMLGGRSLVYEGLYSIGAQTAVFVIFYIHKAGPYDFSNGILIANGILAVAGAFLLIGVGALRIFCTSRRLSIGRRVVMLLTMWIPLVNLFVLLYACRLVYEEYDFEREKVLLRELRVNSELCRTRYPLLMVHGVGFRDLRYFNYWGRIPAELRRNGAVIYYGNQEAFGTIAYNGEDIRKRIYEIMEETKAEKVNIIAHSKGGLDARYAISTLKMAPYVASLTTMSTPHRGCRFVDYACRLPEGLYRFVAGCFDRTFGKFGDRNPDFYTATRQFSTKASAEFNKQTPDAPGVYYQSYASKMKYPWSHLLLSVPWCMIRPLEGDNDGLVSTYSAKWGEFKGIFANQRMRGISHGDMIDLKRQDYKGFDVAEAYVQIVAELKEKGF